MKRSKRWTPAELAALRARPTVKSAPRHRTQQGKRKARMLPAATEFEECRTFIGYTHLVLFRGTPLFERVAHVPNEREKGTQRAMLAAIGVKSGYPDYVIDAGYGIWYGLRIEAKRATGSIIEQMQIEWRDKLLSWNYYAVICEGHRQMIAAVRDYMNVSGATADGVFVDNVRFSL